MSTTVDLPQHKIIPMTTFANRLEQALTESGLRASRVYEKAGVSKAIWYRWAGGGAMPTAENAFKVADTLGVEPRWLITGQGKKQRSKASLTPEQEHIAEVWDALPEITKHHINIIINDYISKKAPLLTEAYSNITEDGYARANKALEAAQDKARTTPEEKS